MISKAIKIKAKATASFAEALEAAQKTVDERHGVIVITGSTSIMSEYWKHKGLKKLSSASALMMFSSIALGLLNRNIYTGSSLLSNKEEP